MNKGLEKILLTLSQGESIIFETDKNFKFGEKNTIIYGEKIFCITSKGRFFIADKEKKFKPLKVYEYDFKAKGIKFKVSNKDNIIAINSREYSDNRSESFIINMNMNDFINILGKLQSNPFKIDWASLVFKLEKEDAYRKCEIIIDENNLIIKNKNENIVLGKHNLCNFNYNNQFLNIDIKNEKFKKLYLYGVNMSLKEIMDIDKKNNISSLKDSIYEVESQKKSLENFIEKENLDNTVILSKEEISRALKANNENLKVFNEVKEIITEEEVINENINTGVLFGRINKISYTNRKIEFYINEDIVIIDATIKKEILNIKSSDLKYIHDGKIIAFEYDTQMFLIEILSFKNTISNIESIENNKIFGYLENMQSFYINLEEEKLSFMQDELFEIYSIDKSSIAEIDLLDDSKYFSELAITLKDSKLVRMYLNKEMVSIFVKDIYKTKSELFFKKMQKEDLKMYFVDTVLNLYNSLVFIPLINIREDINDYYKSIHKSRRGLVEKIYKQLETSSFAIEFIEVYFIRYFKAINCINLKSKNSIDLSKLKIILENIKKVFYSIEDFKNKNIVYSVSSVIGDFSYMYKVLELDKEYPKFLDIRLNGEVTDYKFDEILQKIELEIINLLEFKKFLYDDIIIEKFSNVEVSNKDDITEFIQDTFVRFNSFSAIDNKFLIKNKLKQIRFLKEYNLEINYLDLLNF